MNTHMCNDIYFPNLKNNSVLSIEALLKCLYEHCFFQEPKASLTHHTINVYTRPRVSKLWPAGQVCLIACFCK